MKIVIKDSDDYDIVTLRLNELSLSISKGKRIIVQEIAERFGFKTSNICMDDSGNHYLKVKMNIETNIVQLPSLVKSLVDELN